jgi:methylmalonyl-CoA mutase N-terminal domain/subunit
MNSWQSDKDPYWVTFVIQQGGNNHFTPLHTTQTHDMLKEYNYVTKLMIPYPMTHVSNMSHRVWYLAKQWDWNIVEID